MYRVGVGEEGGESRETAAAAARSLGDVSSVREKKKDNVCPCSAAGAAFVARASFLVAGVSVPFAPKETALTLSHSLAIRPLPPPLSHHLYSVPLERCLASFLGTTEPRLHVPITRVSRVIIVAPRVVGRGRSPPTPPPLPPPVRTASPWSCRVVKERGTDGTDEGTGA